MCSLESWLYIHYMQFIELLLHVHYIVAQRADYTYIICSLQSCYYTYITCSLESWLYIHYMQFIEMLLHKHYMQPRQLVIHILYVVYRAVTTHTLHVAQRAGYTYIICSLQSCYYTYITCSLESWLYIHYMKFIELLIQIHYMQPKGLKRVRGLEMDTYSDLLAPMCVTLSSMNCVSEAQILSLSVCLSVQSLFSGQICSCS